MTFSLCMIVKDEMHFIEDALRSAASFVEELVVVDTGSQDGTREIAASLATTLIDFSWIDDFSAARNAALDAATSEWILVLDADERISPEDFRRIRSAISNTDKRGFYLQTRSYMPRGQQHGEWHPVAPEDPFAKGHSGYITHPIMKVFLRSPEIRYAGRVHEVVDASVPEALRGSLDVPIHHYGDDNPERPRAERVRKYLALMESELAEREDGRLYHIAGASALRFPDCHQKSEKYFLKAAELGYEWSKSVEGAAEAAYRRGNFGPALDLYRKVYEAGYRTPSVCLNMANLLVKTGEKAKAADLLQECLDLGGLGVEIDPTIERNIDLLRS
ncbi:MAG: hypothetical protein Cons2KO_32300 [Congregibacter sp.]